MLEFYTLPRAVSYVITLLLSQCVLWQTLAMVFSFYRYPKSRVWFFENLLELFLLVQILACSTLHGQAVLGYNLGLIAPTGYTSLRYIVFAVVVLSTAIVIMLNSKPWPLLIVAASCLTLPLMESFAERAFAYIFVIAVFFWLTRSIRMCFLKYKELSTSLSALSIKNAIDSLRSGVVFSESDGFILLCNAQMQRLMTNITGKIRRNLNRFYELLASGDIESDYRKAEFEGHIVCLLPDEGVWMFTKTELLIKRKKYIQLTAADITQQWGLTEQLQRQNDMMKRRSEELRETIANLHILSHESETQKAKMRAHGILGERLTLLLRTVRNEQGLNYDLHCTGCAGAAKGRMPESDLRYLSLGLIDELKADQNVLSPQYEFDSLQQTFDSIGVQVSLDGKLPEDLTKGRLFVDIIREGVINAVRHGFATQVFIQIDHAGGCRLRITDNGYPPSGTIAEGEGLGGIRKKLEQHGGALDVTPYPRFVLTIDLPEGDNVA